VLALAVPVVASAQGGTSISPDQQLLRELVDLNHGIALLAHGALHRPGTFPSKTDAAAVDKQHDDDTDHLHAALRGLFNDTYAGSASHADSLTARALAKQTGAGYDQAFRQDVAAADDRAVGLIDHFMPHLTNAQVKTLAQRQRDSASAESKRLRAKG